MKKIDPNELFYDICMKVDSVGLKLVLLQTIVGHGDLFSRIDMILDRLQEVNELLKNLKDSAEGIIK